MRHRQVNVLKYKSGARGYVVAVPVENKQNHLKKYPGFEYLFAAPVGSLSIRICSPPRSAKVIYHCLPNLSGDSNDYDTALSMWSILTSLNLKVVPPSP